MTEKRPQQKTRKTFTDNLKDNLNELCIYVQHCEELSFNPTELRHFLRERWNAFEDEYLGDAQIKRYLLRSTHCHIALSYMLDINERNCWSQASAEGPWMLKREESHYKWAKTKQVTLIWERYRNHYVPMYVCTLSSA